MADPLSSNIGLALPTRGSDSGTWDSPLNSNGNAIDGLFGGTLALSLTSGTTTLTVPAGFAATPSAGPTQSQNAVIRLTGTLSGNCTIVFPRPGIYVVENRTAITGSFYVVLSTGVGGGEVIGLPWAEAVDVYSDGTNMRYRNLGRIGELIDIAGASVPPVWINASTVPPYLLCDGSVYNISAFPLLGPALGAVFGGNGSTTFGVPDLRGRWRIPLDTTGVRITSAGSGINGAAINSSGGAQNQTLAAGQIPQMTTSGQSQSHTHGPGGRATNIWGSPGNSDQTNIQSGSGISVGQNSSTGNASQDHTHTVGAASPSAVTTVPPAVVFGITLMRAG